MGKRTEGFMSFFRAAGECVLFGLIALAIVIFVFLAIDEGCSKNESRPDTSFYQKIPERSK